MGIGGLGTELAQCHGSSVLLLHVIRDLSLPREILDMIAAGEVTASRQQILEDSAEIILDNARDKFTEVGIAEVKGEYLMGDPASVISKYAEENAVDLIVLGHRGVTPGGDPLGSVTRKVLNITDVPCLVVT